MGRAPLPTSIKVLQGNRGKRDLSKKHEAEPKVGEPPMPDFLGEIAAKEWKRLVAITLEIGVLTVADGDILALYCSEFEQYKMAKQAMKDDGLFRRNEEGLVIGQHPAAGIADRAAKNMRMLLSEFGLTPSARTKVFVKKKDKEKKGKFSDV